MAYSKAIEGELLNGNMLLRPGWVRINFNYFIDEETYQYLVGAIQLVAEHGWRLLPFYHFDQACGVWRYQDKRIPLFSDLNDIHKVTMGETLVKDSARYSANDLAGFLAKGAKELLRNDRYDNELQYAISLSEKAEKLRWFVLPQNIKKV
jgi:hypothetical protein